MAATMMIPNHIPALKMLPIASQELNVTVITANNPINEFLFITPFLPLVMQTLCRAEPACVLSKVNIGIITNV